MTPLAIIARVVGSERLAQQAIEALADGGFLIMAQVTEFAPGFSVRPVDSDGETALTATPSGPDQQQSDRPETSNVEREQVLELLEPFTFMPNDILTPGIKWTTILPGLISQKLAEHYRIPALYLRPTQYHGPTMLKIKLPPKEWGKLT